MTYRNLLVVLLIAFLVGISLFGAGRLLAQEGFSVTPWTVDGGGGTLSGAPFTLSGTVSQPDTGVFTGGDFRLYAGFWGEAEGTEQTQDVLFLPAINTE